MGRVWGLLAVAACSFEHGAATGTPTSDGAAPGSDARAPGSDAQSALDAFVYLDAPAPVPITFIQEAHDQHADASHSSIAVTFGAAQVAGDFLVVVISWYTPDANIATLSDTALDTFSALGTVSDGMISQSLYEAVNVAASGSNTFTATFDNDAMFCELRVLEYRGISTTSPSEGSSAGTGFGMTATLGPLMTTHAHDLLFAAFTGGFTNPGAGYTERIAFVGDFVEDQEVTATGSYSASVSGTPANWVGQLAAFEGAQ